MKQAIQIAETSRGICSPNPFVGAVIVKDGTVIGEGSTRAYGSDHAEIQALKQAGSAASDAELYVTLEPCSHYGKTPPCANAVVAAGIRAVYIGIPDPNPLVNGQGIRILTEHGIHVEVGFFAERITQQLEYYLCRITRQRPFVIWKTALSLDGKFCAEDGSSRWISNAAARKHVHHLRQESDVVLTGINTVISDDPQLNVRLKKPFKQPFRAILDPDLDIPLDCQIVKTLSTQKTYIFVSDAGTKVEKETALTTAGAMIYRVPASGDRLDLHAVLRILHENKHYMVMLECGTKLSESFWQAQLIDKCMIYYGNKLVSGSNSMLRSPIFPSIDQALELQDIQIKRLQGNILLTAYPDYK